MQPKKTVKIGATPVIMKDTETTPVSFASTQALATPNEIDQHIHDTTIHITADEKSLLKSSSEAIDSHIENSNIHITKEEKDKFNAKVSLEDAKSLIAEVNSALIYHKNDTEIHISEEDRLRFSDKYTKNETKNLIKRAMMGKDNPSITGIDYPEIPLATSTEDGLMSKEDKLKFDSIQPYANCYIHPNDAITRHVTDSQIDSWNNKADKDVVTIAQNGLMSKKDKQKIDTVEPKANYYIHPEKHSTSEIDTTEEAMFVTKDQIDLWDSKETTTGSQKKADIALSEAKNFTKTRIASLMNSSSDIVEVIHDLAFELKSESTLTDLINLMNRKLEISTFNLHERDETRHITADDRQLMKTINSALVNKINPDWEETDSQSLAFIKNKPESLKADGGNADTLEGLSLSKVMQNKQTASVVVGVEGYSAEQEVNILCNYEDATEGLQDALDKVSVFGGTIVLREGCYNISDTLVFETDNISLKGLGNTVIKYNGTASDKRINKVKTLIKLTKQSSISNIAIIGSNISDTLIAIEADSKSSIVNMDISNFDIGIYSKDTTSVSIDECRFTNVRINAARFEAIDSNSRSHRIINNTIQSLSTSTIAIQLYSENSMMHDNIIKNNIIYDCSCGIMLNNKTGDNTKNIRNIIADNIIYKGPARPSDYSPSNYTICIESGSKNLIHDNIVTGKEIVAKYDNCHDNIYE